ncbi:MAG: NAD(P)H-dependent oxidoreductase subunit E [Thermoanaerobaculales bacterium]|nr:NAD(P)H-dependent oxidoreductase subunit E [Thermoanaerobaculales bacterium]
MTMEHCAVDLGPATEILAAYPPEEASLIQVLQDVHRAYNYLPCDVLGTVAKTLGVPLAKVFSVSTFYKAFSLEPQGDTIIKICVGTACHIRGAGQLVEELERQLGVGPDETTEDMKFTVKTVNCVGACAMAPVMIVGETYHGSAKPARVGRFLKETEADHAD